MFHLMNTETVIVPPQDDTVNSYKELRVLTIERIHIISKTRILI